LIRPYRNGVRIEVWIQPRASRDEIVGPQGEVLKIRLKAPPVEGKANQALIRFLARVFGIPKRRIEILSGLTSRRKSIYISGVEPEEASRTLGVQTE